MLHGLQAECFTLRPVVNIKKYDYSLKLFVVLFEIGADEHLLNLMLPSDEHVSPTVLYT